MLINRTIRQSGNHNFELIQQCETSRFMSKLALFCSLYTILIIFIRSTLIRLYMSRTLSLSLLNTSVFALLYTIVGSKLLCMGRAISDAWKFKRTTPDMTTICSIIYGCVLHFAYHSDLLNSAF